MRRPLRDILLFKKGEACLAPTKHSADSLLTFGLQSSALLVVGAIREPPFLSTFRAGDSRIAATVQQKLLTSTELKINCGLKSCHFEAQREIFLGKQRAFFPI